MSLLATYTGLVYRVVSKKRIISLFRCTYPERVGQVELPLADNDS